MSMPTHSNNQNKHNDSNKLKIKQRLLTKGGFFYVGGTSRFMAGLSEAEKDQFSFRRSGGVDAGTQKHTRLKLSL